MKKEPVPLVKQYYLLYLYTSRLKMDHEVTTVSNNTATRAYILALALKRELILPLYQAILQLELYISCPKRCHEEW